jgi:hypothetical protein
VVTLSAVAQLAGGIVAIGCGGLVLRNRRSVARSTAAYNQRWYDRYSMLNRDRAQRLRRAYAFGRVDVFMAVGLGVTLVVFGALVCFDALR